MARAGPRKVARYGEHFKATAVKLSGLPEVMIKDVAEALDIHPFMLSLWRKQVRDGVIMAKGACRQGLRHGRLHRRVPSARGDAACGVHRSPPRRQRH